ncbi:TPA: portal protein [Kluyvera intermedia]|uniref:Portal protein n=2 Tax=Enterobacteriaceae TaxID=543 RepID=A0AAC8QQV4_9ENTR|nr:portal protein [Phytobacter ursingii]HAT2207106.1 portal protein [Kluyvera intermedia]AKL13278.1 portal protein [Phytobacter ursingii]HAT2517798.1 portal protein [Kluyvera intermedia]HAT2605933.1 portal protein [Kluyvera intermedia]HAT2682775.1 portal protein [Kluyvera intermedia]
MADNENRLESILCKFDADWTAGDEARTEAKNDLFFSRVSQWDDWLNQYTTLQYRGQFDVVRPVVRKLVAEMRQNPIDVLYRPKDKAGPDAADTLMGMYRTDMRHNSAKIAVNVAVREQIESGVGAWRIVTEYEDQDPTSNNQIIRREPIHSACSCVIWDSNSKQMDKSDARHCTIIHSMSKEGWEDYAEKNGLDDDNIPGFQSPNDWVFPWITQDTIHIAEFYEVEEKKETAFIYQDPITGEPVSYFKRDIKDVIDELADRGFIKVAERQIKRRRVYKTILSSSDIYKDKQLIAGEHIPIVPCYGEWGFVESKEVYEGVVRLTKDGQRLRNMIMSFNADIVARNPQKKPFFYSEQISGYEHMYSGTDAYPYYLINRTDENSGDLPPTPIAYMESPEVPQANAYMLEAATNAVKEVATLGVDAEAVNGGQVAFDTVNQLNMRSDLETYVFQDNLATAMRRDGEIYQSMVNDLYDVPRTVTVTLEDGSEKEVQLLTEMVDLTTGERVVLNDIRGRYECYTDVGPSFQSMKQQNRAEILELLGKTQQGTPEYQLLLLQYFTLLDGKGVELMRDYANKQLIIMGAKRPETPEEQQWLIESQQAKQGQQDPAMVQAQGVLLQGQAELAKAQNQTLSLQIDAAKVEAQNQLNSAKIAEIFNNMDLNKQSEFIEFIKTVASFQQNRSEDARANAELLLKGNDQTHKQRMDIANILQSQRQNSPSGSVAETPQ